MTRRKASDEGNVGGDFEGDVEEVETGGRRW